MPALINCLSNFALDLHLPLLERSPEASSKSINSGAGLYMQRLYNFRIPFSAFVLS